MEAAGEGHVRDVISLFLCMQGEMEDIQVLSPHPHILGLHCNGRKITVGGIKPLFRISGYGLMC